MAEQLLQKVYNARLQLCKSFHVFSLASAEFNRLTLEQTKISHFKCLYFALNPDPAFGSTRIQTFNWGLCVDLVKTK